MDYYLRLLSEIVVCLDWTYMIFLKNHVDFKFSLENFKTFLNRHFNCLFALIFSYTLLLYILCDKLVNSIEYCFIHLFTVVHGEKL